MGKRREQALVRRRHRRTAATHPGVAGANADRAQRRRSSTARRGLRPRNRFISSKNILARIVGINVSGDKIHGHVVFNGVRDETVDPGGLRCCGPSDAQPVVHAFYASRGSIIKLVVSLFLGIAHPEINVGLIPHFEIPVGDFVDAVAVHQMLRKMGN